MFLEVCARAANPAAAYAAATLVAQPARVPFMYSVLATVSAMLLPTTSSTYQLVLPAI